MLDNKLLEGSIPDGIVALDPEILLSDDLTRERNDDERMWANVQRLFGTAGMVQADKLSELINEWGYENGYDRPLITQGNPLGGGNQMAQNEQPAPSTSAI